MRGTSTTGAPAGAALVGLWLAAMASAAETPRIVLDPGHGGALDGAVAPFGLREKSLALEIALATRQALEKELGAKVILTRELDASMTLAERVAFANRERPDLFISIHANSMPTTRQRRNARGIETYFLSERASGAHARRTADLENADSVRAAVGTDDAVQRIIADLTRTKAHADSSRLAYAVHQALIQSTSATDRGVQQAPFYVLMGIEVPAVLVEVGFISHPEEGRRLGDPKYQEMIASGIAKGVRRFASQFQTHDGPQAQLQRPSTVRGSSR